MATKRLIDANALLDEIQRIYADHYQQSSYQFIHDFFRAILRRIRRCPTVDVVEVVRCKDCKHFNCDYCFHDKMEHSRCREDDFCSYGERKDNA